MDHMPEPEEKEVLVEQTKFNLVEPLFDRDDKVPVVQPHPPESESAPPAVAAAAPRKKPRALLVGGAVLAVLVVLIVLFAALSRAPRTPSIVVPSASPVGTLQQQTAFEKRLSEIQARLEDGDPTKQDLVFPPVDLKIRLDKKEL